MNQKQYQKEIKYLLSQYLNKTVRTIEGFFRLEYTIDIYTAEKMHRLTGIAYEMWRAPSHYKINPWMECYRNYNKIYKKLIKMGYKPKQKGE